MNYAQTKLFCELTIKSGRVPLVLGSPGVGKTAMAQQVYDDLREMLGFAGFGFFNANDWSPEELAGIPAPIGENQFRRLTDSTSPIFRACAEPWLITIDEFGTADASMFKQLRRLLHERKLGGLKLHDGTRFLLLSNPQAQSLEGKDLPLPMLNALNICKLRYVADDFLAWLPTLGQESERLSKLCTELSGFLEVKPDLLELDPSAISGEGGNDESFVVTIAANNDTWASPRAWESALRLMATDEVMQGNLLGISFPELLAGVVGARAAKKYAGLKLNYPSLPQRREIDADPHSAKLPNNFATALSLAGILSLCQDSTAAWVYLERIKDINGGAEAVCSLLPLLDKRHPVGPKMSGRWVKEATAARIALNKLKKNTQPI